MAKLRLDLHILCKRGKEIDFERNRIMQEAIDKKLPWLNSSLARGVD